MGSDVRFDEGAHRQFADPGGDIPAAVRHGLHLHLAPVRQAVVGIGMRDELTLSVAGITGGSLYFLTENMALEYAPASNVSLIVCTAPVWTAGLMSLLYRGERMTRRQAVGSALAFAGMVLVVLNGRFVLRLSPRGDMLALSAALLWMVYSLVIKRIGGRYPAVFITRKVFFYGLLTILPVFVFQPFSITSEVLARPAVWGNLLFLGIVASMLCYVLWNAAMHRLGAVRTTNYIYFNPLVTIITPRPASASASPPRHWQARH